MSDPGLELLEATAPGDCIGLAALSRLAFHGGDLQPVFAALLERVNQRPGDAASMMDVATLLMDAARRPRLSGGARAIDKAGDCPSWQIVDRFGDPALGEGPLTI